MDIAALIWNKNNFYAAMLETPEAVPVSIRWAVSLTSFLDDGSLVTAGSLMGHFPDSYCAYGIKHMEDEVGVVNTENVSSSSPS